jgi:uncharacterized protein YPO0396
VKQTPNQKEQTRELLQRASVKAIRSLLKLMQDEYVSESVRCNAARSILELHFKGCELADIEASIAELRSVMQDLPPAQKRLRVI